MKRDPIDELIRTVEPRTFALAGVALFLLFVLAGSLYVIKPAWIEYSQLKQTRELERETFLLDSGEAASSIASIQEHVDLLRTQLYGGAAGVPRRQIESFVVDSLDQISSRHGVQLLGITPDQPATAWMFEELPYEVKVQGSYFAIHRWLRDVEEELRPMVVKQFQLSPTRNDSDVILELRVVAYRANEQART